MYAIAFSSSTFIKIIRYLRVENVLPIKNRYYLKIISFLNMLFDTGSIEVENIWKLSVETHKIFVWTLQRTDRRTMDKIFEWKSLKYVPSFVLVL